MRYMKMLALASLTAVAVLGASGTASATIVTSPAGTALAKGAVIKAEGHIELHNGFVDIKCNKTSGEGEITDAGSSTETARGEIFLGTYSDCGSWTVTVLKTGTSEVHTRSASANGNGTLTASGAEITVEGFGVHCIFTANNTDIGEVIGGNPASVTLMGTIARSAGRSGAFCGSSGALTGQIGVTSPSPLYID